MNLENYDILDLKEITYEGKTKGTSLDAGNLYWEFDLVIPNVLRIVSDNLRKHVIVDINEEIPNHDEIIKTIQNTLWEYTR